MTLRNIFQFMTMNLLILSTTIHAEVILDGTQGSRGSLQGPNFAIDASFGQQVGANLFHSFESFNLNSSESATFFGAADISNVINRVTGGHPSLIDGLFSSRLPNADVYFLNPAGIMFGPNAYIDVPASLYVSSGNYLKLGDNGRFDATTLDNTLLSVAPPTAFGFLDNAPSRITVTGSLLGFSKFHDSEIAPPDTLALVGGDIDIDNGHLISLGNDIQLISVASAGEAPLEPSKLTDDTFASYGTISITDTTKSYFFGNIDSSGFGGGEVFIRAGQFFLDNSWIFADTNGDNAGRGININVSEELVLQNAARITTEVYSMPEQFMFGRGNAGNINIKAGDISLTSGSQIQSSTITEGNAGNITLAAQRILSIKGADSSGNFRSGILSNSLSTGTGGDMVISADALIMKDGATMRAETRGFGDAGNLSIQTNTLTLSNGSVINVSTGHRTALQGTGKAGKLAIVANESVSIGGGEGSSGLVSNTFTLGQGGTIAITSPDITVFEKGLIQADSQREGDAGNIVLNAGSLKLNQGGSISAVAISSGLGGNVKIQAQNVYIKEGSYLSASSTGKGDAGNITLNLGDKLIMRDSLIGTHATSADGGNISIMAQKYLYLIDSEISTSVGSGYGGGGNIILQPDFLVQDQSPIIAEAYGGPGGNIDITTIGIYQFSLPSLSRISASSQFGIDGEVYFNSPTVDMNAMLAILSDNFVEIELLKKCRNKDISEINTFYIYPVRKLKMRTPEDFPE